MIDLCIEGGRSTTHVLDPEHTALVRGPAVAVTKWAAGEIDVTAVRSGITVGGDIISLAVFSAVLPDPRAALFAPPTRRVPA